MRHGAGGRVEEKGSPFSFIMKNKFNFMATLQSAVDASSFSITISCMMKLTRTTKPLDSERSQMSSS